MKKQSISSSSLKPSCQLGFPPVKCLVLQAASQVKCFKKKSKEKLSCWTIIQIAKEQNRKKAIVEVPIRWVGLWIWLPKPTLLNPRWLLKDIPFYLNFLKTKFFPLWLYHYFGHKNIGLHPQNLFHVSFLWLVIFLPNGLWILIFGAYPFSSKRMYND